MTKTATMTATTVLDHTQALMTAAGAATDRLRAAEATIARLDSVRPDADGYRLAQHARPAAKLALDLAVRDEQAARRSLDDARRVARQAMLAEAAAEWRARTAEVDAALEKLRERNDTLIAFETALAARLDQGQVPSRAFPFASPQALADWRRAIRDA